GIQATNWTVNSGLDPLGSCSCPQTTRSGTLVQGQQDLIPTSKPTSGENQTLDLQICVWCWHHIMDMAEKDDTEGRCPACREPYDKEKIVGRAAKCEWLADEINSERKLKSQKTKSKTSEGRKDLSSVRVIKKTLVCVIGIPAELADEDLLQRKDYFGQYGKVLKVSISRTAAGCIQYSPNNTCSVYITYSKEEEAIRCIQSVHGYTLDGYNLRACFGTTKYCHAWLRNQCCNNPDCLYLHDVGTQEDSFSKDEIVTAYTRSRILQITGATNNLQRPSGNTLPPPKDDCCSGGSASSDISIITAVPNNPTIQVKGSPPDGSSGRSLPATASWGLRTSNGKPPTPSSISNDHAKQKPDSVNGFHPTMVSSTTQGSVPHNDTRKSSLDSNGSLVLLELSKQYIDDRTTTSDTPSEVVQNVASTISSNILPCLPTTKDNSWGISATSCANVTQLVGADGKSINSASSLDKTIVDNGKGDGLSSIGSSGFLPLKSPRSLSLQRSYPEDYREPLSTVPFKNTSSSSESFYVPRKFSQLLQDSSTGEREQLLDSSTGRREQLLDFNEQRMKVLDSRIAHNKVEETSRSASLAFGKSNGNAIGSSTEFDSFSGSSNFYSQVDNSKNLGMRNRDASSICRNTAVDIGESTIISNILSLDLDAWDDSLTSPHNLAKLLSETDNQQGSLKMSNQWKVQNNNQSRFSFARQEDFTNHKSELESTFANNKPTTIKYCTQDSAVDRISYFDRLQNGVTPNIFKESDAFSSSQSYAASSKRSVSRAPVSAPPGFSVLNRPPPPGFSSQERMDQPFESISGNHMVERSSFMRNQYPTQVTENFGSIADEFHDPAVLAVGKGTLPYGLNNSGIDMRSPYSSQLGDTESDPRLQMLLQQSISANQNLRYQNQFGDRLPHLGDAYRSHSRLLEQSQAGRNLSPFAHQRSRSGHMPSSHWGDDWNDVQSGNDLGMAELKNERLGFTKRYPSLEDLNFRMPSSGDIYNRTFGM
ncbi:hypothetical protein GIB67_030338, partial [Kingdonia uniflora]